MSTYDDFDLVAEDDRRHAHALARDLGIAEEPLLVGHLLAAISNMRNDSWANGYGAGVLYGESGEVVARAAVRRARELARDRDSWNVPSGQRGVLTTTELRAALDDTRGEGA